MIKITYQEGNMTISYDLQDKPSQKEIIETAIFVLERALGEKSVYKQLKDYVKVSEDYIHSFIAEHERNYEPEEE